MSILTASQIAKLNQHQRKVAMDRQQQATVSPAARIATLCSKDVLFHLGVAGGMSLAPSANFEAILGTLATLHVEDGTLHGPSGKPVEARVCLGLLGRLGVQTDQQSTITECVGFCERLGMCHRIQGTIFSRVRVMIRGSSGRLVRCIVFLEERGYRARMSGRLSELRHSAEDSAAIPCESTRRRFTTLIQDDFAVAA